MKRSLVFTLAVVFLLIFGLFCHIEAKNAEAELYLREGIEAYLMEHYLEASVKLKKSLELEPDNERARQFYERATKRAKETGLLVEPKPHIQRVIEAKEELRYDIGGMFSIFFGFTLALLGSVILALERRSIEEDADGLVEKSLPWFGRRGAGAQPPARKELISHEDRIKEYQSRLKIAKHEEEKLRLKHLLAKEYAQTLHLIEKSIDLYEEIKDQIDETDKDGDALYELGNLYFYQETNLQKAHDTYTQLVNLFPQSKWVNICRDRINLILKNLAYPQALEEYLKAVNLYSKKKYKEASHALQDLIKNYPNAPLVEMASTFLGQIYHRDIVDKSKS